MGRVGLVAARPSTLTCRRPRFTILPRRHPFLLLARNPGKSGCPGGQELRQSSAAAEVGLTHLHLTPFQAMNTRWSDASAHLKAWAYGPPDWVLNQHPGLSRSPLPGPSLQLEAPALEEKEEQLLDVPVGHGAPRSRRHDQQIEEQACNIEGVASCGWFLGAQRSAAPDTWVAPAMIAPGSARASSRAAQAPCSTPRLGSGASWGSKEYRPCPMGNRPLRT